MCELLQNAHFFNIKSHFTRFFSKFPFSPDEIAVFCIYRPACPSLKSRFFESPFHDSLYIDDSGVGGVADLGGEVVEEVETLVVGGQLVFDTPGRKDEERAAGAGLEAAALGLPVGGDGFLLEVDDGEALVDGGIDNDVLGR